jgi:hypothetical protein
MTYHPLQRWGDDGTLQSAARGQEFVAVPRRRDDTFEWISAVLQETLK